MCGAKVFLFDLDGTLVDSLPAVERAWSNWARRHGLAPEEVLAFSFTVNRRSPLCAILWRANPRLILPPSLRVWSTSRPRKPKVLPRFRGAIALLNHLNKAGIPWAIVTSGSMPVARARHKNSWASRTRGVCNR
ncbi:HAD hydrolase-like protein [Escherichia coli]|nr:HAD hydrolase-like protein [Escherichia coli]